MAISLIDNLKIQNKKQNVERDSFATIADMVSYSPNYLPNIFHAMCEETGKMYVYNVNNDEDETLGKWRVLEGSGSGAAEVPIEKIKVNGELQTPVNKVVDITVPSIEGLTKDTDLATIAKSGDYEDLINKPTIPDITGLATETWVNEQGFLTQHQDLSNYATKDEIPTIPSKVSELTNDSNYQTAEQVNSTVTTEIAKVVADAPESLNTLKEMSDWIAGHEDDASAMNSAISDNKTAIASLQSGKADKSDIPTTVAELTDSADYAKKTDLHSHDNKTVLDGITSTKVSDWDTAKTHADSAHAPSTAQANVIETVKVNGTALTPSSKAVNVTVPTTVAQMTDSSSYAKKTDIPTTLPANGGNANTVNNHTVKSDVPENAVFTDTVYDDTEVKGSITKLNRNLTENNVTLAVAGNTYIVSYSAWNVGKEVFFNFDLKVNDTLNANAWYDIGNLSISPNQNFYYTCIYNNNQIGMMQITKNGLLKLYIGDVIYQSNTEIIASGVYHI